MKNHEVFMIFQFFGFLTSFSLPPSQNMLYLRALMNLCEPPRLNTIHNVHVGHTETVCEAFSSL